MEMIPLIAPRPE